MPAGCFLTLQRSVSEILPQKNKRKQTFWVSVAFSRFGLVQGRLCQQVAGGPDDSGALGRAGFLRAGFLAADSDAVGGHARGGGARQEAARHTEDGGGPAEAEGRCYGPDLRRCTERQVEQRGARRR